MTNDKTLCMIPGPIEFHEEVLSAMSTKATSHVDPHFINVFGECLEAMKRIFFCKGQPFIISGAGVLSWDFVATNFIEPNQHALVLSTGVFGNSLKVYGAQVTEQVAEIGHAPCLKKLEEELSKNKYSMVTITQVDTSTGVLSNVEAITKLVKKCSKDTLVVVDGVCSVGAERLYMDDWGVDIVITGSQKALGTPPGLCLMMDILSKRKEPIRMYYCNINNWTPSTFKTYNIVMKSYEARKPSYFSTPAVQTVYAFRKSLELIEKKGIEKVIKEHEEVSNKFKDEIEKLGLKIVAVNRNEAAHTMTAIYFPDGVEGPKLLKSANECGLMFAGGLHPQIGTKYFRVGHMGISAVEKERGHVDKALEVIKKIVQK